MSADRCPTCDREGCDGARLLAEHRRAMAGGDHDAANVTLTEWAALGCRPVDWRARAIAAESRIAQVAAELADDLATAQAEIDRAIASPRGMGGALPSMSRLRNGATPTVRAWLGRIVERLRGGAAESDAAKDRDDARSWRNAIEGAKEPGDPVLRAIAELLSCTYLDAVPTPADDDMRRELAVAARVANDERRAKLGEGATTPSARRDAAKWRKVEPLIERLRGAVGAAHLVPRAEAERRITEIASAILAATAKEPS